MYFYCIAYSAEYMFGLLCLYCSVWGFGLYIYVCVRVCVCVCSCFSPSFFVLFYLHNSILYISSNMGGQLDGLIPFWQPANCTYWFNLHEIVYLANKLSLSLSRSPAPKTELSRALAELTQVLQTHSRQWSRWCWSYWIVHVRLAVCFLHRDALWLHTKNHLLYQHSL